MSLRRSRVEAAAVPVQLPAPPTQATCAALVQALLKHTLFSRGHIPYLYDQLLEHALEEQQRRLEEQAVPAVTGCRRRRRLRLSKADKRQLQFLQRCEALLDSIAPSLFATDRPTRCFILLGASTTRPREAYEVVLPAAQPLAADDPSAAAAAKDDYACRVVLRQLICSAPDLPEGTAAQRPGKVFLLIQGSPGQELPPGFVAKRSFRLLMRNGVRVTLNLGGQAEQQPGVQEQQQQQQQHANQAMLEVSQPLGPEAAEVAACGGGAAAPAVSESVWLQSRTVLRGLKSSSGAG